MRLIIVPLLLLGTAMPALAAEPGPMERLMERRAAQREARQEPRAERPQRERASSEGERPAPRFERRPPVEVQTRAPPAEVRETRERRPDRVAPVAVGDTERRSADNVRWRERAAEAVRREREERTAGANALPTQPAVRTQDRRGEAATFDRLRDRVAAEGWRQEWRRDQRYDWRRHRDRDRNRFRIGLYIDPFGWNYRPWQLGGYLPSRFYRSSYWIDDPWYYRLPPAYGPYRWIRYYDDVLLIDMRTGRIVDRIPRFFW